MNGKPTVISIFAGCGGSSLGYKMAGFKELLAIDFDENCKKTFNSNFPNIPFWRKNIIEVKSKDILEFTKLDIGELDLLDGSPPCQGFSVAGKRNINDKRNRLFLEFFRLIKELQPKVFVMENVPGLSYGEMKGVFNEIMEFFGELPYKTSCKMLNAKYYGVPQVRKRLIWIGTRNDLKKEPIFPKPNLKIITVENALKNLIVIEKRKEPGKAIKSRVLNRCIEGEGGEKYNKGKLYSWRRILRRKPCPTITKIARLLHWRENGYLTIQEIKRLSTFPDDFNFHGNFLLQWSQIGNCVPPKMMRAIAKTIKEKILD
jgi:DNA (cytosine-5)-methyltransferase 1